MSERARQRSSLFLIGVAFIAGVVALAVWAACMITWTDAEPLQHTGSQLLDVSNAGAPPAPQEPAAP